MDVDILLEDIPRRKKKRLSPSQFGLMVDFISLNPELVWGRATEVVTKEDIERKWEELAAILNSEGTGAQKSVVRWRKSWRDLKFYVKNKVERLHSTKPIPGCQRQHVGRLTELEEKTWNLIKSWHVQYENKSSNASVKESDVTASYLPQGLEKPRYIIVNVDGVPLNAEQVESTSNILLGLEASSPRMEYTSNNSEQSETTNDVAQNSQKTNHPKIKSEPQHSIVSEASIVSSISVDTHSDQENILLNQSDVDEQNSSNNRSKAQNFKRRKKENGINQLLQRQNELLECIAASIARIEKSLETSSSQHVQRKSAMENIAENIDKIAGSLGSVSKSLKKISEK